MNLSVSNESGIPLYRQIYHSISGAILRGELHAGDALPPIRTVATELRISVISVKRAWEELDRDGYIVTAVGRGSFVASLDASALRQKRRALLAEDFAALLHRAENLGADRAELRALADELLGGE